MLDRIAFFEDNVPRDGPANMALDEAIVRSVQSSGAVLRIYLWADVWTTFGYFTPWKDVLERYPETRAVRRWTGGGIVRHERDLTYSLCLPPTQTPPNIRIYAEVHYALARALRAANPSVAVLIEPPKRGGKVCFDNPVSFDLAIAQKKVAGAALRRNRIGILLQGTIQGVTIPAEFGVNFAKNLASRVDSFNLSSETLALSDQLALDKYGSLDWNRKF
jgi:lipoate-protein ligase A